MYRTAPSSATARPSLRAVAVRCPTTAHVRDADRRRTSESQSGPPSLPLGRPSDPREKNAIYSSPNAARYPV